MATIPPEDFRNRVLNRRPKYDYRNFRLSDFITPEMRLKAQGTPVREWDLPFISDQGPSPHCVGFGWLNFGNCDPVMDGWQNDRGHEIYYAAKDIDGEPGAENGSSTLSGVKAFMKYGFLSGSNYAFANSLEDVKVWVLANGPVVVGTNWYDSMFVPNYDGVVDVYGYIAGGHEYLIIGYDRESDLFHCANSWGTGFGINGTFYIRGVDFERLMREEGDACTTIEISATPEPPPLPPPTPEPPPAPVPTPLPDWLVWLFKKIIEFLQSLIFGEAK